MSRIGCELDLFIGLEFKCLESWFFKSELNEFEFVKRLVDWLVDEGGGGIDIKSKDGGAWFIDLFDFHAFSNSFGIGFEYGAW